MFCPKIMSSTGNYIIDKNDLYEHSNHVYWYKKQQLTKQLK